MENQTTLNEPRKFQIHLSTAVALMFVASLLLFFNLVGRVDYVTEHPTYTDTKLRWGWPVLVCSQLHRKMIDGKQYKTLIQWKGRDSGQIAVKGMPIALNACVFFIALYITFRFCEWRIRSGKAGEQ